MNTRLLQSLSRLALGGDGVGGKGKDNYKLAACLLDKRGRPLAYGKNSYKSHPIALYYGAYPHVHAELDCCLSHGLSNCSGCTMVVIRTLKDGRLTMAKPCVSCMKMMKDVGIKNVKYTNWSGSFETVYHL